jgi:zinc transport system substrate-binding protein
MMHSRKKWRWLWLLPVLAVFIAGCNSREPDGIVAGTAHIAVIVDALGGGENTVHTLIPGGMCPGHFDMRPGDMENVAAAELFLLQPWQREARNIARVAESAGLPAERMKILETPGNWMLPEPHKAAVREIAALLAKRGPGRAAAYRTREKAYLAAVDAAAAEMRGLFNGFSGKAACNEMQRPFAEWCGIEVAAGFGRLEEASVAEIDAVLRRIRDTGAVLIIDNLQSGDPETGRMLARESGAGHVVLSNFPGAFDDTGSWEKAFRKNCRLLKAALENRKKSADE